jgi:hypothetical protein
MKIDIPFEIWIACVFETSSDSLLRIKCDDSFECVFETITEVEQCIQIVWVVFILSGLFAWWTLHSLRYMVIGYDI